MESILFLVLFTAVPIPCFNSSPFVGEPNTKYQIATPQPMRTAVVVTPPMMLRFFLAASCSGVMERSIARFLAVCLGPPLLLGLLPVEALLTALLPEPLFAVRPDLGGGGPADLLGCVPGGTGAGASAAGGLEFPWSAMIFSYL